MTLAIIDYGSGNLRSVAKAFEHVASGQKIMVTSDAKAVASAERIVLPGVGAYGDCMRGLTALDGMLDVLNEQVIQKKKNFLGICVGMQMMFERGMEHGEHRGLGWLKGEVVGLGKRQEARGKSEETYYSCLVPSASCLKIPHMGWNTLSMKSDHPILRGIENGDHAYFVHSYHAKAAAEDMLATTDYGGPLAAVVGRDHMIGTQFHPEKSQKTGLAILHNFLRM